MLPEVAGTAWLDATLGAIPEFLALVTGGGTVKAFEAGSVPPNTAPPYATVGQRMLQVAHPVGAPPTAATLLFDIALWDLGTQDDALQPAFRAIDARLSDTESALFTDPDGVTWSVSSAVVGMLPKAPPPRAAGDPRMVRLGRSYEVFVGAT